MERIRVHAEERLTSSVVIYSIQRQEIWMIGDCQCLVDDQYYDHPKPLEAGIAEERSVLVHQMLKDGTYSVEQLIEHDYGRDLIVDKIISSCRLQNLEFSVADGFDIPIEKTKRIDTKGCHQIVLASDGYPFLYPTLVESESKLAELLHEDPLCINLYKATKGIKKGNQSFDDRTYIRFTVSE